MIADLVTIELLRPARVAIDDRNVQGHMAIMYYRSYAKLLHA